MDCSGGIRTTTTTTITVTNLNLLLWKRKAARCDSTAPFHAVHSYTRAASQQQLLRVEWSAMRKLLTECVAWIKCKNNVEERAWRGSESIGMQFPLHIYSSSRALAVPTHTHSHSNSHSAKWVFIAFEFTKKLIVLSYWTFNVCVYIWRCWCRCWLSRFVRWNVYRV